MQNPLYKKVLKYNTQVPRYTSYPTAPHFSEVVTSSVYSSWLRGIPEDATISLYLHIPFCKKLCWYCGCRTQMTNRYAPVEDYVHLLKREIRLISNVLQNNQRHVLHIHFGGGSPTLLLPEDFVLLMEEIRKHFVVDKQAEIAIELDPRGVTEAKILTYSQENVNRASIGVQDFHTKVQQSINREQSFEKVYETVRLLKKHQIKQINLDLIYGLPEQTLESIKDNISYAMLLEPNRIALFGYAHVPWMKKHMRLIDESTLPGNEERLEMFHAASEKLTGKGYIPIGFDHFARTNDTLVAALRQGTLKRNFQGYTTDVADVLIGLGVSSISKLPQGYVQNTTENNIYKEAILNNAPATAKGIAVTKEDKFRQLIIEKLMCNMKVNLQELCNANKVDIRRFDPIINSLKPISDDGLISIQKGVITINPDARQIVRFICAAFDKYHNSPKNNLAHSRVT